MARGGKRAGAGRPQSDADLSRPLSLRLPGDMLDQLTASAERKNSNLTAEIRARLGESIRREREHKRDRAMRALCFLIGELAHQAVGVHVEQDGIELPMASWRSNPFFFEAFRLAVDRVLKSLAPPGEIIPPKITSLEGTGSRAGVEVADRWLSSFQSPEARAEYAADYILDLLRSLPRLNAAERKREKDLLSSIDVGSFWREFYGIPDAAKDLQPRPESDYVKIEVKGTVLGSVLINPKLKA